MMRQMIVVVALILIVIAGYTNAQMSETKMSVENEDSLTELKGTETIEIDIFCDLHEASYMEELKGLGIEVLSFEGGVAQAKATSAQIKMIANLKFVIWIEVVKRTQERPAKEEITVVGTATQEELTNNPILIQPLPIEYKLMDKDQGLLKLTATEPLKLGIIGYELAKHKKELTDLGVEIVEETNEWLIIKTLAGNLKGIASLDWVYLILPAE